MPAASDPPLPAVRGVPPATPRRDGFTPARQRRFLEALAATGNVSEAARQVGLSRQAVYAYRNRSGTAAFREAWDRAFAHALRLLGEVAYARAIDGVEEPVFWKGEQIGTRRRYNDRLLMFLLRGRDPWHFAPLPDLRGFCHTHTPHDESFDTLLDRIAPAAPASDDGEAAAPGAGDG